MDPLTRWANSAAQRDRLRTYRERMDEPDTLRVVTEGDSWFQHPLTHDLVDSLIEDHDSLAIRSLDAAGDTLGEMLLPPADYWEALRVERPRILMLSGGGNDVLAGPQRYLVSGSGADPDPYINRYVLGVMVGSLVNTFEQVLRTVAQTYPGVHVLLHGYSHVFPDPDKGKWIARPMAEERNIDDPALQKRIADRMVDLFNEAMAEMVRGHPHATFLDLRDLGVPVTGWYDEIHLDPTWSGVAAGRFWDAIQAVA